ncbi:MAG: phosphogluconate dehydrogenase, partial [Acidimicrobiia bacterium]|nr:phosphogluconate dehydrogenase [Acidimicrobiia bacterium]
MAAPQTGERPLTLPPVGLLHPGAMGAVLGAELVGIGCRVAWVGAGRSPASRARAEAAG